MIAADRARQRPPEAKLLVLDAEGRIEHSRRSSWIDRLRPGDLVVANDAATLPASLRGVGPITSRAAPAPDLEVRLAARPRLRLEDSPIFTAVVFGAGDFHQRTEDRPLPPPFATGDRLVLGPLVATVEAVLAHPRLVSLRFEGSAATVLAGIARHGRPIQYAHMTEPLELWDVWTPIAGLPVAFEAPSAGFALDWRTIVALRRRGIGFATLTLAAGISSTGDPELDRRLPFDEPYRIPEVTARAIAETRARGGRIVAVGTTVVRALEHAAIENDSTTAVGGLVTAGERVADQRVSPDRPLTVVDVLLSGTHEPGTSHYDVLRAFAPEHALDRANAELEARGYRTHEFGDSVLIERSRPATAFDRARSRLTAWSMTPSSSWRSAS